MIYISQHVFIFGFMIFFKCRETIFKVVEESERFILLRNSSVFVDKTLLIKRIFQYDHIILTAPHKFGKTTNIQMIKLFLGNHNNRSHVANYFRSTYIWRDRGFIVKHLCQYPIIYCNLKPKGLINNFKDVGEELKISIKDAFQEHKYLLSSKEVNKKSKQQFWEYCRLRVVDFEVGLKFLSELLHAHHKKKVVILIDDYDFTVTYSIFKKTLDSTCAADLVFRLIDNAINLNEFVERSVVMGCIPFRLGEQFSGLYLLEHFKFLETKEFTPYFGFTKNETETLLEKFNLKHYKDKIFLWYGGYSYLRSKFYLYNPWSVLKFIKTRTFDIHWIPKESRQLLFEYIEPHYVVKELIAKLLKNESVTVHRILSFTTYEVDKLKERHFTSYSTTYTEDDTGDHLFLQLLLESGHLTYADQYKTVPISTRVTFPNLEIKKVFEQILVRLSAVYSDINRRRIAQRSKLRPVKSAYTQYQRSQLAGRPSSYCQETLKQGSRSVMYKSRMTNQTFDQQTQRSFVNKGRWTRRFVNYRQGSYRPYTYRAYTNRPYTYTQKPVGGGAGW